MLSHQKIQETDESSLLLLLAYGGDCPKKISFLLEAQLGLREKEKKRKKLGLQKEKKKQLSVLAPVMVTTTRDFVWIWHLKVVSRLERNPNVSIATLEVANFSE